MTRILALDTSCEACSVALAVGDERFEAHEEVPRQHTQKLLPMVQQLLTEAGCELSTLDAIAFGAGPGSFTGLRISAGVAQGLALGAELPLMPVSTLAALAEQARQQVGAEAILASLDARMGEVYWGMFEVRDQQILALDEARVCPPAALPVEGLERHAHWYGIGPGWRYRDQFPAAIQARVTGSDEQQPRASAMLELALQRWREGDRGVAPEEAMPVYIRDEVAWQKSKHRQN